MSLQRDIPDLEESTGLSPTKPVASGARFALRAATAEAHANLDRLYSRFDLGCAEDYAAFLLAHAPAFVAVEQALEASGAGELWRGWRDRRRSTGLLEDIAALGLTAPEPGAPPVFHSEAEVLGGIYVLEGSRLGGAMLVRTVAAGLPTAFLTPGNPADWRAFTELLDRRLSSDLALTEATSAALAVFALFERYA